MELFVDLHIAYRLTTLESVEMICTAGVNKFCKA